MPPEKLLTGLSGFGNLNRYKARLVLQSVSEISSQEIDYAQRVAPAERAPATAGSYTPGSPSADTLKRAAAAFGAQGESNGVTVGFGGANEVPKYEATKSNSNSPDGILFHALYDSERLKGAAMDLSIAHDGNHIADIRSSQTGISDLLPYGTEFRAWQTTLIGAISNQVKSLELARGYTVYDQSWAQAQLGKNAFNGISGFLTYWAEIINPPKPSIGR